MSDAPASAAEADEADAIVSQALSILDMEYQRVVSMSKPEPPLPDEELKEAAESAAAEGYAEIGALPAFSDDDDEDGEDGEIDGGGEYAAFDEDDDAAVAAPSAEAPDVSDSNTSTKTAAAPAAETEAEEEAWVADFPAPTPPPAPKPQPLAPEKVDQIRSLMAGLDLAPPPPQWASTVPESVWMHQLLRRGDEPPSSSRGRLSGGRGRGAPAAKEQQASRKEAKKAQPSSDPHPPQQSAAKFAPLPPKESGSWV